MSMAGLTITVLFVVNLFIFIYALASGNSMAMPPIISAFASFGSGGFNWSLFAQGGTIFVYAGVIAFTVYLVGLATQGLGAVAGTITGTAGTFNAMHIMTIIAIAVFLAWLSIPDFGAMGFPYPLDLLVESFFGMLIGLAVFGLFRGE